MSGSAGMGDEMADVKVFRIPAMTEAERGKMKELIGVPDGDDELIKAASSGSIGAYRVAAEMVKEGHKEAIQIAVSRGIVGSDLWKLYKYECGQSYDATAKALLGAS